MKNIKIIGDYPFFLFLIYLTWSMNISKKMFCHLGDNIHEFTKARRKLNRAHAQATPNPIKWRILLTWLVFKKALKYHLCLCIFLSYFLPVVWEKVLVDLLMYSFKIELINNNLLCYNRLVYTYLKTLTKTSAIFQFESDNNEKNGGFILYAARHCIWEYTATTVILLMDSVLFTIYEH